MNNSSIKPIKKYDIGGSSDDCYEVVVDADGKKRKKKKKGCGFAKAQKFNKKQANKAKRKEIIKGIGTGIGAAGLGAATWFGNFMGIKDKVQGKKKGGAIKSTVKKTVSRSKK